MSYVQGLDWHDVNAPDLNASVSAIGAGNAALNQGLSQAQAIPSSFHQLGRMLGTTGEANKLNYLVSTNPTAEGLRNTLSSNPNLLSGVSQQGRDDLFGHMDNLDKQANADDYVKINQQNQDLMGKKFGLEQQAFPLNQRLKQATLDSSLAALHDHMLQQKIASNTANMSPAERIEAFQKSPMNERYAWVSMFPELKDRLNPTGLVPQDYNFGNTNPSDAVKAVLPTSSDQNANDVNAKLGEQLGNQIQGYQEHAHDINDYLKLGQEYLNSDYKTQANLDHPTWGITGLGAFESPTIAPAVESYLQSHKDFLKDSGLSEKDKRAVLIGMSRKLGQNVLQSNPLGMGRLGAPTWNETALNDLEYKTRAASAANASQAQLQKVKQLQDTVTGLRSQLLTDPTNPEKLKALQAFEQQYNQSVQGMLSQVGSNAHNPIFAGSNLGRTSRDQQIQDAMDLQKTQEALNNPLNVTTQEIANGYSLSNPNNYFSRNNIELPNNTAISSIASNTDIPNPDNHESNNNNLLGGGLTKSISNYFSRNHIELPVLKQKLIQKFAEPIIMSAVNNYNRQLDQKDLANFEELKRSARQQDAKVSSSDYNRWFSQNGLKAQQLLVMSGLPITQENLYRLYNDEQSTK